MRFQPKAPFDRPIRVVVADIDGTITTPDRTLSVAAQAAVMRLETRKIPVILASGNVLPSVRTAAYMVGATGPIVAENGGLVLYLDDEWREIIEVLADRAVADEAYEALKAAMPEVEPILTHRWRESEIAIKEGPDLDEVRRAVEGFPVRVEATGWAVHIIDERVNKGTGVLRALELINIPPEEVLAVGDSENDISVFEVCGLSVAVDDREPGLVKVADHVTRQRGGDGFFEAVAEFLGPP